MTQADENSNETGAPVTPLGEGHPFITLEEGYDRLGIRHEAVDAVAEALRWKQIAEELQRQRTRTLTAPLGEGRARQELDDIDRAREAYESWLSGEPGSQNEWDAFYSGFLVRAEAVAPLEERIAALEHERDQQSTRREFQTREARKQSARAAAAETALQVQQERGPDVVWVTREEAAWLNERKDIEAQQERYAGLVEAAQTRVDEGHSGGCFKALAPETAVDCECGHDALEAALAALLPASPGPQLCEVCGKPYEEGHRTHDAFGMPLIINHAFRAQLPTDGGE